MTPRTPLIPICARRPPIPIPPLQYLFHALQARDHFFPKGSEDPVADYLDGLGGVGGGGCEEVVDGFVVDFEVGTAEKVFARGGTADVGENIFHRARNYTRLLLVPRLYKFIIYY